MKEYIVSQEEKGKRLDTYIPSVDTDITRTSAQRLIEDGNILVNGKNAKVSYKIQENDKISVEIPEPKQIELKAQNIPIEIIYRRVEVDVQQLLRHLQLSGQGCGPHRQEHQLAGR